MIVHLSGCVILDRENRIYLLHRNKDNVTQWELPGGKVEINETLKQAAIREAREELGIIVKINKELGEASFSENETSYRYTWYLAEIISGKASVVEPELFDDLKTFKFSELKALQLSSNMKILHAHIINSVVDIS